MSSDQSTERPARSGGNRRRWLLAGFATLAVAVLGVGVMLAPLTGGASGTWRHRHGGHGFFGSGGPEGEMHAERLRFGVEWVLRTADASDEQVEAIVDIAERTHADLRGLKERHRESRAVWVELLTADEIDAAAVETQRRDSMALAEEGSTRIASALLEAAEVLTPEQRRKLAEERERFRRLFGPRHPGPDGEEE